MTPHELLESFETLADAPDGVKRLRELVLQFAVHGKLVRQDPGEEPAGELMKNIALGRGQIADTLRTRPAKDLPEVSESEMAFAPPEGWRWCRLHDLGVVVAGGTPSSSDPNNFCDEGGHPWLTPADMRACTEGKWISRGGRNLTEQGLRSCSAQLMPAGTVVFSSRAPIGYVAIAANSLSTNQGFKSLVPAISGLSEFVRLYLLYAGPRIDAIAPGTTFKEVSGAFMSAYPIPLPPLAEQRRIVARVDELMGLLGRLEAARAVRDEVRRSACDAALAALREAEDTEAVESAWARISGQMNALFIESEDLGHLRAAILQLAVQGNLVRQDPDDEPATVLLSRIESEATDPRAGNSRKDSRNKPAGGDDTKALPLPTGWVRCSLQTLVAPTRGISYGVIKLGPEPSSGGVPILRCSDVRFRRIDEYRIRHIEESLSLEFGRTILHGGELVVNVRGTLGGCAVVPETMEGYNVAREVAVVPLSRLLSSHYILTVIASPLFQRFTAVSLRGTAYEGLNIGILREFSVPLPPLAEQHRIVAKVDVLIALCDRLEARLAAARELQAQFAAAAVHHLDV